MSVATCKLHDHRQTRNNTTAAAVIRHLGALANTARDRRRYISQR